MRRLHRPRQDMALVAGGAGKTAVLVLPLETGFASDTLEILTEADILGERRRLYEWLFEPLYAIRANLLAQSSLTSR